MKHSQPLHCSGHRAGRGRVPEPPHGRLATRGEQGWAPHGHPQPQRAPEVCFVLGHGPQGGFVLGQGPQGGFVPRSPRPGSRRPLEAVVEAGGWQQSSTAAPGPRWGRAGGAATHRGGGGPGPGERGRGSPGVAPQAPGPAPSGHAAVPAPHLSTPGASTASAGDEIFNICSSVPV